MDTITFRNLIAPLTAEDFFANHYGKSAVHVPGGTDKFSGIFSWDDCNALLAMTSLWSDSSMRINKDGDEVDPRTYSKPGVTRGVQRSLRPNPVLVNELMRDGATMVLDLVEVLSPAITAVTEAIAMVTCARVTCNAYCSWHGYQGFNSHFDTMDVFVLHVEGEKTWQLYEGRFENPAELSGFNYPSFELDFHEQKKGAVSQEVTMTPGDFLYVPKGQYHDALASSGDSLHLTFGTTQAIGQDLVKIFIRSSADDPLFREPLPPHDQPEAHEAHVQKLADRIRHVMVETNFSENMREEQRRNAFADLPGISLPGRQDMVRYRVRGVGAKLVLGGNGMVLQTQDGERSLDDAQTKVAQWALERDSFTADEALQAFGDGFRGLLETLIEAGLIEPL